MVQAICQACRRAVDVCTPENVCDGAKAASLNPRIDDPLEAYEDRSPALFGRTSDYRAEALSRDPTLTSTVERMCGSFSLAYVIRNDTGHQLSHSPREATAWAGASGATANSLYFTWRNRGREDIR